MADQIFEIKFHNLFGYKFGRIVDEAHNLYSGDEGWATKDEVKDFIDKYIEALNKEHLRRVNRQKYKRCLAMVETCIYKKELDEDRYHMHGGHGWTNYRFWDKWQKTWLELSEKFKPEE